MSFTPFTFSRPVTLSSFSQIGSRRLATLEFRRKCLNILQGRGLCSGKFTSRSLIVIKLRPLDADFIRGLEPTFTVTLGGNNWLLVLHHSIPLWQSLHSLLESQPSHTVCTALVDAAYQVYIKRPLQGTQDPQAHRFHLGHSDKFHR